MVVLSSFVKFNKIHYSEISVIFMYLFIHLIFFFILITLNVPTLSHESSTLETMPSISDPTLFIGGISPSTAYKTMAYILLLQEIGDERALRRETNLHTALQSLLWALLWALNGRLPYANPMLIRLTWHARAQFTSRWRSSI